MREDEYHTVFAVQAMADGMRARLENVTVTVWDDMGEFFDGPARDFRGWQGERIRSSNHLAVTAAFGSGGHVYLRWTLRSGCFPGDWTCTMTNVIEAGEKVTALAANLREFLHQGQAARIAWCRRCRARFPRRLAARARRCRCSRVSRDRSSSCPCTRPWSACW